MAWNGLPDVAQIWMVDGKASVIFTIPGTKPPVFMRWTVPRKADLESFFGPDVPIKYSKTLTAAQWKAMGGLNFGTTDEIPDITENPFASWTQTMATEAKVQPWILDADYRNKIAEATIEGRGLTEAEIQTTTWWRTHNEGERAWMKLYHGDRKTALQRLADNRITTRQQLRDAGIENPPAALINEMADRVTKGTWTVAQFSAQAKAIADPFSGIVVDATLLPLLKPTQGTTMDQTLDVRELATRWLGPVHGGWTDAEVNKWAGVMRNDADGEERLTAYLKTQRKALFPEYEDVNLTYDDIAAPWRNFMSSQWGQTPDEMDPLFSKLIKQNDLQMNGELLRREGFTRGIGKVQQDAQTEMLSSAGGVLRRAIG